jgi:LmbE family N-acetylglucosaminyl deacetylase
MTNTPVRLLILGAHPDDAEFHAGGLLTHYRQLGHVTRIVSVTNGAAGHHRIAPADLARIRRAEAADVARQFDLEYDIWDFPDGELQPSLEVRRRIIREIRQFAPDLVLTHRTCDYHPDHRAVGLAVQDASYMVTVPHIVPDVPALRADPVVAYMTDLFTKPGPLQPDVILDVTLFVPEIVRMLACHACQFFDWLPYNMRVEDQLPGDEAGRRDWLHQLYLRRAQMVADRFREALVATYGAELGREIRSAEAYEISEYARQLDPATRQRLFGWLK